MIYFIKIIVLVVLYLVIGTSTAWLLINKTKINVDGYDDDPDAGCGFLALCIFWPLTLPVFGTWLWLDSKFKKKNTNGRQ